MTTSTIYLRTYLIKSLEGKWKKCIFSSALANSADVNGYPFLCSGKDRWARHVQSEALQL
jgi:hypothetical protein